MTKLISSLLISELELLVHLGWTEAESKQQQTVLVDVEIYFPQPPKACASDDLADTICYATLIDTIRDKIRTKHFHLIEHLTNELYRIIKTTLSDKAKVIVRLTKHPNITGLRGGVRFSHWDCE